MPSMEAAAATGSTKTSALFVAVDCTRRDRDGGSGAAPSSSIRFTIPPGVKSFVRVLSAASHSQSAFRPVNRARQSWA